MFNRRVFVMTLKTHLKTRKTYWTLTVKLTVPKCFDPLSYSLCVCMSMASWMTFVLSLFAPGLFFVWCFGRAVLGNCGISWISSLLSFRYHSERRFLLGVLF